MKEQKIAYAAGSILGRLFRHGDQAGPASPAQSPLNLRDIQGLILRGYRMPMVRHFLLKVTDPAAARRLLGRLTGGDESDAPQITTAENWHIGFEPGPGDNPTEPPRTKPDYCLNVGITWQGLIALEVKDRVPNLAFKSFGAFIAGAAARAELVGDTGPGAPRNWIEGFRGGDGHVLVTLHALSPEAMAAYSDRLSALFVANDAFRELWRGDGAALVEMRDGHRSPRPRCISATPTGSA